LKRSIVCKFGGSSVENATQIEKVKNIVSDNKNRKYVVVSAPGRDEKYQEKITDHLINIAMDGEHLKEGKISSEVSQKAIVEKFRTICDALNISSDVVIEGLKKDFKTDLSDEKKIAFLSSRGEYYNALIIADYFKLCGMDTRLVLPEDIGFVVSDDYLSAKVQEESYKNLETLKNEEKICLMPGFYGVTREGEIAVLSRGGSDLTGGEIAYSVNASLYENWSDIDGVYEVDPRIVSKADVVPRLTFK
jgi:aspartate kinase